MNSTASTPKATAILELVARRSNSLVGFATIALPSGLIISDVVIHLSAGRAWASPPAKALISREGAVQRDNASKIRYTPIISFATKDLRERFSNGVIEALRRAFPDALPPVTDARP